LNSDSEVSLLLMRVKFDRKRGRGHLSASLADKSRARIPIDSRVSSRAVLEGPLPSPLIEENGHARERPAVAIGGRDHKKPRGTSPQRSSSSTRSVDSHEGSASDSLSINSISQSDGDRMPAKRTAHECK
jgi:hypothetical protein